MFLLFLWPLQYWGLTKLHPIVMPVWVSERVSRGRYIFVLSAKSICRLRTTFHCTTSEINERDRHKERQEAREGQTERSQEDAAARALMKLFMGFRQINISPPFISLLRVHVTSPLFLHCSFFHNLMTQVCTSLLDTEHTGSLIILISFLVLMLLNSVCFLCVSSTWTTKCYCTQKVSRKGLS